MFSVRQYAMNSVYKIYCVVLHTKSGILFHKRYCNTKAIKFMMASILAACSLSNSICQDGEKINVDLIV